MRTAPSALSPRGLLLGLMLGTLLWLVVAAVVLTTAHAEPIYNPMDSAVAITEAADTYGVSETWLLAVARCESNLRPYAVGDSGHSFGLAQLNDRPTGLLAHFHRLGYLSAFDPFQSADYLGRVFSGEFAGEGITWRRWSCQ